MKIAMGKIPIRIELDGPAVGDVYRAKGGRGTTKFFVIASIVGNMAHALGIDGDGVIVSTTSYGVDTFARRNLVARVPGMADLTLNLEWEEL
ncbi:hypothetical protein Bcep22_gp21 [Burkholderia phage Bcep22]|uniref:Uncharacterized protein n=2 Tax=Lessievirus TaxID=1720323 RepID=Q6V7S3_9CAUD|nr:hypothetical protein Bcep22_gp21 [Burkholderia phage Bcep22]YP_007236764.1 hypothetical protein G167_gp67 [Burkholderia phage BcepMigl]AAQ54955.1 hypothetical protein Bcep22_gp21 [Burkholderia phage Bcep22]AFN39087.1 hypothetical protein BcepMigl_gp18 [Burkholderia phage BcepMigl]